MVKISVRIDESEHESDGSVESRFSCVYCGKPTDMVDPLSKLALCAMCIDEQNAGDYE